MADLAERPDAQWLNFGQFMARMAEQEMTFGGRDIYFP